MKSISKIYISTTSKPNVRKHLIHTEILYDLIYIPPTSEKKTFPCKKEFYPKFHLQGNMMLYRTNLNWNNYDAVYRLKFVVIFTSWSCWEIEVWKRSSFYLYKGTLLTFFSPKYRKVPKTAKNISIYGHLQLVWNFDEPKI